MIDWAIDSRVLAEFRQPQKTKKTPGPLLSDRKVDILHLVSHGLSNQEIAEHLSISEKTVGYRLSLVFNLLHLKDRTEAALYALWEELVKPDQSDDEGAIGPFVPIKS